MRADRAIGASRRADRWRASRAPPGWRRSPRARLDGQPPRAFPRRPLARKSIPASTWTRAGLVRRSRSSAARTARTIATAQRTARKMRARAHRTNRNASPRPSLASPLAPSRALATHRDDPLALLRAGHRFDGGRARDGRGRPHRCRAPMTAVPDASNGVLSRGVRRRARDARRCVRRDRSRARVRRRRGLVRTPRRRARRREARTGGGNLLAGKRRLGRQRPGGDDSGGDSRRATVSWIFASPRGREHRGGEGRSGRTCPRERGRWRRVPRSRRTRARTWSDTRRR